MAGYRFCRSDDVELLVEAYNVCYRPHFAGLAPLDAAGYKRAVREFDLWASSCMVAIEDRKPIGVMLGAKRETENCILAIGIRPDRFRRGHAGHMLESLGRKLTILGPPRIVAELPAQLPEARRLFESVGYRHERRFVDWVAPPVPDAESIPEAMMPIELNDLADVEAPGVDFALTPSWARAPRSLSNLAKQLRGFAVGGGNQIAAYVLWRDLEEPRCREVAVIRCSGPDLSEPLLRLLITACRVTAGERPVTIPRIAEDEIPAAALEAWGFVAGDIFDRLAIDVAK